MLVCCMQATAVVRASLANHILVSHTTPPVAVMVRPPVVAPAQGMPKFELISALIHLHRLCVITLCMCIFTTISK